MPSDYADGKVDHAKIKKWFEDWDEATEQSRELAARDKRYYDGDQWSAEEIKILQERHQPVLTKNRIAKKINYLIGMEIQTRSDPNALPRTPMHDEECQAIRDALRYVADNQDFDNVASSTWRDVLVPGYGGAVVEVEVDESNEVEICLRHVPWDRLWYDLRSTRADFKDASYVGAFTWWHVDDAIDFYRNNENVVPNFEELIKQGAGKNNNLSETTDDKPHKTEWTQQDRVRIIECWWKEGREWYWAVLTADHLLIKPRPSGLADEKGRNTCPLIMESAFVDQDGQRYGAVRQMISPQDEVNKRSSKSLHLLSVSRLHVEDGALINPHEAQTQYARASGVVRYQRGALSDGRVRFESGTELAQGQIALLEQAKQEIDGIGPDIPQLTGQASSGREVQMRQQLGSLELKQLEDNHRRWKRRVYEQIWYRIRRFWTEEKWMRVRDDSEKTGYRFVAINRNMTRAERGAELIQKGMPLEKAARAVLGNLAEEVLARSQQIAQQQLQAMMAQSPQQAQQIAPEQQQQILMAIIASQPEMQEPVRVADTAQMDVDIVITESPDVSILQQEEFERLSALMQPVVAARPELAPKMVELIVEASELRSKKRLAQILQKQPEPDPEQIKMQQMLQQLQLQKAQLELQLIQAEAQNKAAWAVERQAEAQRESATAQKIGIEAAQKMDELSRSDEKAAQAAAETQLKQAQAAEEMSRAQKQGLELIEKITQPQPVAAIVVEKTDN